MEYFHPYYIMDLKSGARVIKLFLKRKNCKIKLLELSTRPLRSTTKRYNWYKWHNALFTFLTIVLIWCVLSKLPGVSWLTLTILHRIRWRFCNIRHFYEKYDTKVILCYLYHFSHPLSIYHHSTYLISIIGTYRWPK